MSQPIAIIDVFQAIADPTRRAILNRLLSGEQAVKDSGFNQTQKLWLGSADPPRCQTIKIRV